MELRKLGSIAVSAIGMGCMGFSHGYGDIPDRDYAVDAIRSAHDAGCTLFDTAESYAPGLDPAQRGHNERIVGEALAPFRDDVVIATKFHLDSDEAARRGLYGSIRAHLEASLERLRASTVDLYYLHRVNRSVPVEDVAEVRGRFIDEGLVRGWGLSQVDVDTIDAAHRVTPVSAVQNIYSMVERGVEGRVIPYCLKHGIGLVPFSPIASGLLSGALDVHSDFSHHDDVRKFVPQLSVENIDANRPIVDLLRGVAARKGATPAQISLAWMLRKYPNVVPIPGSKNRDRILENLGAAAVVLTNEEFVQLETALDALSVYGSRGFVQFEGEAMSSWGKNG